jgi:hypothetical protein
MSDSIIDLHDLGLNGTPALHRALSRLEDAYQSLLSRVARLEAQLSAPRTVPPIAPGADAPAPLEQLGGPDVLP